MHWQLVCCASAACSNPAFWGSWAKHVLQGLGVSVPSYWSASAAPIKHYNAWEGLS